MTSLDYAKLYAAEWDFALFPVHWIQENGECSCQKTDCRSAGKHPITKDGFHSATRDLKQIERWWLKFPQANIGIATGKVSGIVVLDVDPRHGGFESLAAFSIPETMKCRTGGGGEHYYFKYPAGDAEIKSSAGKLGAGLDVRGEGGYVVAPPSNHTLGVYAWEQWEKMAEWPFCNAGVPPAVGAASRRPSEQEQALTGKTELDARRIQDSRRDAGATAEPGTRNSTLASLAGSMRRRGFSPNAITQALLIENQERCRPPLENAEVRDIARSIGRYESGAGWSADIPVRNSSEEAGSADIPVRNSPEEEEQEADKNVPAPVASSIRVWNLGEFLSQKFEAKETVCFEAGRGDVVMVAARTNGGKSTLLRNCLLSLATGRAFPPFVPENQKPRRVMLLDFETGEADLQQDLARMTARFSAVDHDFLAENFHLVPRGMIGGELFQLNFHFNLMRGIISSAASEVIIIDNISSAFNLWDENSNAEVTRKVVKPLSKLAQISNATVIFAHHIGKAGESARDDVYQSRGASALSCLAKSVFNLKGRVDLGETVDISCVKQKNGQNFSRRFALDAETRWFEETGQPAASARKPTNHDLIVAWIRENSSAEKPVKTGDIVAALPQISRSSIMHGLREAMVKGFIISSGHGAYRANPE